MIAPPPWMGLTAADPGPDRRWPQPVRETVAAVRAAGYACDYAGRLDPWDVYLVGSDERVGRVVVDLERGSVELWSPVDPNGAPASWGQYDPSSSGAAATVAVIGRGWS